MKTQMEDVRNDADSTPNRRGMRNTADIAELCAMLYRED